MFDPVFYREANPDLKDISSENLKRHYEICGERENRLSSEEIFREKFPNFNLSVYQKSNNDLKFKNRAEFLQHFWTYGHKEGRPYCLGSEEKEKKLYIVSSTQLPGNGGASTNCYKLYRHFQKMYNIIAVFFSSASVESGGDYYCFKSGNDPKFLEFGGELLKKYKEENIICLCKNYLTPIYFRKLFPRATVAYLVAGSMKFTYLNKITHKSFGQLLEEGRLYSTVGPSSASLKSEYKVVEASDIVLTNSHETGFILRTEYPKIPLYFHEINTSLFDLDQREVEFGSKDIDIIFCVTNHSRPYKGSKLASNILKHPMIAPLKKIVIGDGHEIFFDNSIQNVTFRPKMEYDELQKILRRVKLLLLPSSFDSSPNVLYEAISNGCNVLASKNIGGNSLLPNISVMQDLNNVQGWVETSLRLVSSKVDYNLYIPQHFTRFQNFINGLTHKKKIFLHDDRYLQFPSFPRFKCLLETRYHCLFSEIIVVDLIKDKQALSKIVEQYQEGDYFVGRLGHSKKDFNITHKLYPQLEKIFNKNIYPTFNDYQYFEDKSKQTRLFKLKGYNTPLTYWVENKEDYDRIQCSIKLPCVRKTPDGAGNSGVSLIRSREEIQYPCLVQELIENNFTLRIIVIGEKVFGYKRINKEDDFLVQSSDYAEFPDSLDMRAIKMVYGIYKDNNFCSMSFDLMFDPKRDDYVLLEISYTFATKYARKIKWYYDMVLGSRVNRPYIADVTMKDYTTNWGEHIEDYQMEQFFRSTDLGKIQQFDYEP